MQSGCLARLTDGPPAQGGPFFGGLSFVPTLLGGRHFDEDSSPICTPAYLMQRAMVLSIHSISASILAIMSLM
jgi:hypothetical protein